MKRLLLILILTFSFQSFTKADNIGEFAIEDFLLFESLLIHFDIKQIETKKKDGFIYPNKDFYSASFRSSKFNNYDKVQFHLKANDSKYSIYSISGSSYFKNNINDCYNEMKKISLDIESLFNKPEVIDLGYRKLRSDKSSKIKTLLIDLKNKSYAENAILIECYDYSIKSEKNGDVDKLLISIDSKEFRNWINNKAFN